MKKKEEIVCGLDVGTETVCCLIARAHPDGRVDVIGSGYGPSAGLRKGVVVDLEEASIAIRSTAQEAESKAGQSLDWVTVGISGDHIQGVNCRGAVSITGKHHEVTVEDVAQVVKAAQTVPVTADREVIHVLPQEFFLDDRGDIRNPAGLIGQRLVADVHVVTADGALTQNLINAVNKAQMRVRKVVLPQLAAAHAVLTDDERELGVALVDIGGGTTDLAVILRDALRYTSVLPVGGQHFTRDLAVGLRTTLQEAERIKREAGSVLAENIADDESVEIVWAATNSMKEIPRRRACEILEARAAEVLELIKDQISRAGYRDQVVAGAVFTGGGSMLEGLAPLAEEILEMPVRLGMPQSMPGLAEELIHPVFATAVGLTLFSVEGGGRYWTRVGRTTPTPWLVHRFLSWVGS